jgi:DNA-binding response OmpR family regulator
MQQTFCGGTDCDAAGASPKADSGGGIDRRHGRPQPRPSEHGHTGDRHRRQASHRPPILYAYDDPALGEDLRRALAHEGVDVLVAHSAREVWERARATRLALLLLDLDLPDMDESTVRSLVQTSSRLPVVLLSTRGADEDIALWLRRGADDYIVKPFNVPVQVSRIKALLRRTQSYTEQRPDAHRIYRLADAVFDEGTYTIVGRDNTHIRLTATEGHILRLLLLNKGRVLPTSRIMEHVHGYDHKSSVDAIRMHVMHLRQKIAQLPNRPQLIRTVPGIGYSLREH